MRITGYEIRKILASRNYVLILCALLIINGSLVVLNGRREGFSPKEYRKVQQDIAGKSSEEAIELLRKTSNYADFCLDMMFGMDIDTLTAVYGDELPELFAKYESSGRPVYTGSPFSEKLLLQTVLHEYLHCSEYEQYLKDIQKSAELMERLAGLQGKDRNDFNYRNVKKTAAFFKGWTADGVRPGASLGIEKAVHSDVTDYLIVLYVFLVAMALVMREKELKQLLITRTTRKGRVELGIGKLAAEYVIGAVTVVLFYSMNLILYGAMYGLGDMSRRIQSIAVFRSCPLQVSVGWYLVLLIIGKILAVALFITVFFLIAVCCQSAMGMYIAVVLLIGAEALLFFFRRGGALLYFLRKLNLLAFLKTDSVFRAYENLNLFGTPVAYRVLFLSFVLGISIIVSVLAVSVFAKQKGVSAVTGRWNWLAGRLHFPMHENLFLHECYKIFLQGKVLWVLGAFVLLTVYSRKPLEVHYASPEERYYHLYMLEYEGSNTPEKYQRIMASIEELDELAMQIMLNPSEDRIADEMRLAAIEIKRKALGRIAERIEYLNTTEDGKLVFDSGYLLLIGHPSSGNKDWVLALQLVLMMTVCLVGIYGIEYDTGMAGLVASYRRGRGVLSVRKYAIALSIATIIYVLTYGTYFYNVLEAYGTKMIGAPAYSIPELKGFSMSIRGYLVILCLIRYLCTVLAATFVLVITRRVKRTSVALGVCAAVLVMPILFALLGIRWGEWILFNPLFRAKLWK